MDYESARKQMVQDLRKAGILKADSLIKAMEIVPRHEFIPFMYWDRAYYDSPVAIGHDQTISAPHMNAMMCEALDFQMNQKVLEIGTGSGYHAAIVAQLVLPGGWVYTIERIPELGNQASCVFQRLHYTNITVIHADGSKGLREHHPYDRILITAACPSFPMHLIDQLSPTGKICVPVGSKHGNQRLILGEKHGNHCSMQEICQVVFVPLIGEYGFS